MRDYTRDIERYFNGEMSPEERHAVEREALRDPLLAEAMEGAAMIKPRQFSADVNRIKNQLQPNKTAGYWLWTMRLAAAMGFFVLATFTVRYFMHRAEEPELLVSRQSGMQEQTSGEEHTRQSLMEVDESADRETERKGGSLKDMSKKSIEPKNMYTNPANTRLYVDSTDQFPLILPDIYAPSHVLPQAAEAAPAKRSHFRTMDDATLIMVSGRVVAAEDGLPLPRAEIRIKETGQLMFASEAGNYQIEVREGALLTISFPGMKDRTVIAGRAMTEDIHLEPDKLNDISIAVRRNGRFVPVGDVSVTGDPMPSGGFAAYTDYLKGSVRYPHEAHEKGIQGVVIVEFTVTTGSGAVNLRPIRSIGGGCVEELIRAIAEGPSWRVPTGSNMQNADTLRVNFRFRLSE